jgi:nucleotide-binding universal stress UspA family protein
MPFKNVSVVFECDPATLESAALLAREHGARLTLIHAMKPVANPIVRLGAGARPLDLRALMQRERLAALRAAADKITLRGLRPRTRLVVGDPFAEIIRDVFDRHRDLVIMTSDSGRGLRRRFLGSMASHLVRKCPVPVLVMKPGRRISFRNVAVALDVEGESARALNARLLAAGAELAQRSRATLHVLHAWQLAGESLLLRHGGLTARQVSELKREEEIKRRHAVEKVVAPIADAAPRLHVVAGEASHVIPRLASRLRVDLLVMGTVSRTGVAGLIIGNTAERILDAVDCSLLVLKPDGFVSPLAPGLKANWTSLGEPPRPRRRRGGARGAVRSSPTAPGRPTRPRD